MKQCKVCKKSRDYIAFYRTGKGKDGFSTRCRMCWKPGYSKVKPDESITEKTCPDCKLTKSVIEFGKNSTNKSGYSTYCSSCSREKAKARYQNNPEYNYRRRLATKLWQEANPEKHQEHIKKIRMKRLKAES